MATIGLRSLKAYISAIRQAGGVPSEHGRSAVVVPVPAVERLASGWREVFDGSAVQGMPAHITVLYPFLDDGRLTSSVLAKLARLCAQSPVLDVEFRRIGRFPAVLCLDPEPAEGLRRITACIAEQWPEAPPYGGGFAEVIPHLTIAQGAYDEVMAGIESDLLGALPVRARLVEACLYVFDGTRWRPRARLPFQRRQGAETPSAVLGVGAGGRMEDRAWRRAVVGSVGS